MIEFELAIVIPAFKAAYLTRALAAIAAQSDQRFCVYIGDDCSPEDLAKLVQDCSIEPKRVKYHRFETNLGAVSLVRQWDRCVQLSNEPWVWIFSDDDEMEEGCVAAFYKRIEETKAAFDIYRFNTIVIDGDSKCTALSPTHPPVESAREYAYFFLRGVRRITQQEAVFRRDAYARIGGIIDLPLAWFADSAFAIACGQDRGICTISGPVVRFRLSGGNISSKRNVYAKWDALMQFIAWLQDFVKASADDGRYPTVSMIDVLLHERFMRGIKNAGQWVGLDWMVKFRCFLYRHFPNSVRLDTIRILKYNFLTAFGILADAIRRKA